MVNTNTQSRLPLRPTHLIDQDKQVSFYFNGQQVSAYAGDTIGSALYASGVRIFSRSFKYHRSRGLLCGAGRCPNCLMTVDGAPNVRSCTTRVEAGMKVTGQNAWPSLEHDALSVLDKMTPLMPVGFYYKTFHKPKLFWEVASPIIKRVAGIGAVDLENYPKEHSHHENLHTDVAVIGGGPAGMSAALAAAEAGARVTIIDDQLNLGGHLRFDGRTHRGMHGMADMAGYEVAAALRGRVESVRNIQVLSDAIVFGLYEGNFVAINQRGKVMHMRAKRVVVATGAQESPLTFDRNDISGVMLSTAAQRLMHLYGVRPGASAIIGTASDHGYHVARELLDAGVRIAAVADARPSFPSGLDAAQALQSAGVLVLPSHAVARAEGSRRVVGGVVARIEGGAVTREERQLDCDLILMSGGFQPVTSLLQQAGANLKYDAAAGATVPADLPQGVYAAGKVTGTRDAHVSIMQGRLSGLEAVGGLAGKAASAQEIAAIRDAVSHLQNGTREKITTVEPPIAPGNGSKQFVCFCEDITAKDVAQGVDEGFEDVQILKRYSTVTMGPCQGKMCHRQYVTIVSNRTGASIDSLGSTTARPPFLPVTLGDLAGPAHMPRKRTAIHRVHEAMGAKIVDVSPWLRPHNYGDPKAETMAVRKAVGIIDVSTLGKLDVAGKDAAKLLDKVYTHRFSDLRPGRIRYGIITGDNGAIMDDGTVTRLSEDRYFVTTSTANIDVVEEWFKWWMAGTGMCCHVTNITSGYAAINVAGPKARDVLKKLTSVDLSSKAAPYMSATEAVVAGVQTRLLRIGFVGETGWELHFPAEYGEYMWTTLMDAGKEFGISPFGLEAQRVLRLEKKHIIPGQDTDILSNPLSANAEWAVKFDKPDFIGRGGLLASQKWGMKTKLVGFVMVDPIVPHDGSPIVLAGTPVGRVTSARMSPTIGKGFGLAWVPTRLATDGTVIQISVDGRLFTAEVQNAPVYDPEGVRLRE
ncbi:MAG: FAD-dependent oxidoreductase [SAR202 cluster bacterium]|nr:FAD-dependent oxidoreductase [SAR202 cluster bacterium]